jgi:hypothetical protein
VPPSLPSRLTPRPAIPYFGCSVGIQRWPAPGRDERSLTLGWAFAGAASLIYACALMLPSEVHEYSGALDASWPLVLHDAFAKSRQFGPDVVYTFGPWGFLFGRNLVDGTRIASVAGWMFLALAVWRGAFHLVRRHLRSAALAFAWLIVFLAVLAETMDGTFLSVIALWLFVELDADRPLGPVDGTRWLLLAALALVALVKFTFLVCTAAAVMIVAGAQAIRRSGGMTLALGFVACMTLWWIAAGQSLSGWLMFVRSSADIAATYPEAMVLEGPFREVAALLLGTATLLSAAMIAATNHRSAAVAGLSVLLFVAFKASVVRHDAAHVVTGAAVLGCTSLLGLLVWPSAQTTAQRRTAALGLVGVTLVAMWLFANNAGHLRLIFLRPWEPLIRIAAEVTRPSDAYGTGRSRAGISTTYPLPPIDTPVDIYPWQAAVPIALGLEYRPRPIFQSYQASSESLMLMNASHLRSTAAPDTVLFDVASVDGRLPALDDALSWPLLLSNYSASAATDAFLVLRRRATPQRIDTRPMEATIGKLNEPIAVPQSSGSAVSARVRVGRTWFGTIKSILFRPAPVFVVVDTADGLRRKFRLVPSMAAAGFVVSPLVLDRLAFLHLGAADGATSATVTDLFELDRVVAITVVGNERELMASINVMFAEMKIDVGSPDPGWYAPLMESYAKDRAVLRGVDELVSAALWAGLPAETRDTADGPVFFAPAPFHLPVVPRGDAVELEYGLLDGAWSDGGASDGVEFSVVGACEPKPLWSRRLRPAEEPSDRGPQRATVSIPRACSGHPIALTTEPAGTAAWDWAYWRRAGPS